MNGFSASLDMRSREGNGTPLQYSCLENPMDRGAWWDAVHGVAKHPTWLSDFTFTFHFHALVKETATHSSAPGWRIPGTGEPGGLPFLKSSNCLKIYPTRFPGVQSASLHPELPQGLLKVSSYSSVGFNLHRGAWQMPLYSVVGNALQFSSIQFSCSVVSDSLRPHELQHARPPCPSQTPGVYSNSCPSSQ